MKAWTYVDDLIVEEVDEIRCISCVHFRRLEGEDYPLVVLEGCPVFGWKLAHVPTLDAYHMGEDCRYYRRRTA